MANVYLLHSIFLTFLNLFHLRILKYCSIFIVWEPLVIIKHMNYYIRMTLNLTLYVFFDINRFSAFVVDDPQFFKANIYKQIKGFPVF